jgi:hypothetical protein
MNIKQAALTAAFVVGFLAVLNNVETTKGIVTGSQNRFFA